jgi:hypothetical protein
MSDAHKHEHVLLYHNVTTGKKLSRCACGQEKREGKWPEGTTVSNVQTDPASLVEPIE